MGAQVLEKKNSDTLLQPLMFPLQHFDKMDISGISVSSNPVSCLLCDKDFSLANQENEYMKHLLEQHKLVISSHKSIAYLDAYLEFWRKKLNIENLSQFCSAIKTNQGPEDIGEPEQYYLLSEKLPEDKKIRESLHKKRLDYVLKCQQLEREDTSFSKLCLFCNKTFTVNRSNVLTHMLTSHNFNLGQPDNIVFICDFLNLLEEKLKKFQCLYCEMYFKNHGVLKEHMRKKSHKQLNPNNSEFDKFYVVNYVEMGRTWKDSELERMFEYEDLRSLGFNLEEEKEQWSDWDDDTESNNAFCLFCSYSSTDKSKLLLHMKETHGFDFMEISNILVLDYYQEVRLVNFIRRQVYKNKCISCKSEFDNQKLLIEHMTASGHINEIPSKEIWDQPEFLFPTYENDNFLWNLDDKDQNDSSRVPVIKEDIEDVTKDSILKDKNIRESLDDVKDCHLLVETFEKLL